MRDLETLREEFARGRYLEPEETYEVLACSPCLLNEVSHACYMTSCEHSSRLGCRCEACYSDDAAANCSYSPQGYDSAFEEADSITSMEEDEFRDDDSASEKTDSVRSMEEEDFQDNRHHAAYTNHYDLTRESAARCEYDKEELNRRKWEEIYERDRQQFYRLSLDDKIDHAYELLCRVRGEVHGNVHPFLNDNLHRILDLQKDMLDKRNFQNSQNANPGVSDRDTHTRRNVSPGVSSWSTPSKRPHPPDRNRCQNEEKDQERRTTMDARPPERFRSQLRGNDHERRTIMDTRPQERERTLKTAP